MAIIKNPTIVTGGSARSFKIHIQENLHGTSSGATYIESDFDGANNTRICTAKLTFVPDEGYTFATYAFAVNGATGSFNRTTGVLTLSEATGSSSLPTYVIVSVFYEALPSGTD